MRSHSQHLDVNAPEQMRMRRARQNYPAIAAAAAATLLSRPTSLVGIKVVVGVKVVGRDVPARLAEADHVLVGRATGRGELDKNGRPGNSN